MIKKKWLGAIIIGFCLMIVVIVCLINSKTDEEMIKQLFDLDVSDYEIIEVNNELRWFDYGGRYKIQMTIEKEQLDDFIASVEEYYWLADDSDGYKTVFRNLTGREWTENDIFYESLSSPKRNLGPFVGKPKTVSRHIIISESDNSDYSVEMYYLE